MDAIASGTTEVTACDFFAHFKHLTDLNGKGEEHLEDDFKVSSDLVVVFTFVVKSVHPFWGLRLILVNTLLLLNNLI